ncbi:DUF3015 domain-containing protein [bacterium]|nr:DUF3015 domain-containing protein [bacterium]
MWKQVLVLSGIVLATVPSFASGNRRYGMAGCGLGSAVMGRSGSQFSAATTNGTVWSKYLGITSGTSNCRGDRGDDASVEQERFMYANYEQLSKEMARGEGSSLEALSHLLGCGESQLPVFKAHAQKQYSAIFAAPGAVAALEELKDSMQQNDVLSVGCVLVSQNGQAGVFQ